MKFVPMPIPGAYIIDLEPIADHRGFFARGFCARTFAERGLTPVVGQCNISFNYRKGTIRGLHYQVPPAAEAKLLRCTRGAIYEVMLDLRPESPTYLEHAGVELSDDNRRLLYIPEMCAAGCQALTDRAELAYHTSAFYTPECERGIRYNDSAFAIRWPLAVSELSEKDKSWPDFEPAIPENIDEYR